MQRTIDTESGRRHADGEPFDVAYRRLWPVAVRLGRLLTGSSTTAEDLAQDALVGMHRNWSTVDNPDGYLRTAVVNRARNHARRTARAAAHRDEVAPPTGIPEIDETWALLQTLSDRQRAALVLRYYLDLPLAEIAQVLGCRVGTVKSTIHRGLERLRETVQ